MAEDESAPRRGTQAGLSPVPVWDCPRALELLRLGVEGRLSQGWRPLGHVQLLEFFKDRRLSETYLSSPRLPIIPSSLNGPVWFRGRESYSRPRLFETGDRGREV